MGVAFGKKKKVSDVELNDQIKIGKMEEKDSTKFLDARILSMDKHYIEFQLVTVEHDLPFVEGEDVAIYVVRGDKVGAYESEILKLTRDPRRVTINTYYPEDVHWGDKSAVYGKQRKYVRIEATLLIQAQIIEDGTPTKVFKGRLYDISLSGLSFNADYGPPEGSLIHIKVQSFAFPLDTYAKVIRSRELREGEAHVADEKYRIATQYYEISTLNEEIISHFIIERQKAQFKR